MSEQQVITPGGARPKSQVHLVESGVVDGSDGRLRHLSKPAGEVLRDFGELPERAAGVPLMPANVSHVPGPVPSFGSGWITYSSWTNSTGTPVSSFSTTWVVPDPPATESGQIIFLFNGIQNSTMIYQPVLQWGSSAAGGGNYWAVASWYVDGQGGPALHTNLVRVNPGQLLIGVMTLTGHSGSNFDYNCDFTGIGGTSLPVTNIQQLTWLIETLECYGITKSTDYPDTDLSNMSAIKVSTGSTHPTLNWTANNPVTDCGQHTVIVSDSATAGEIDLNYYGDQPNWKWCNKCQALTFAGNASQGPCPAGGNHTHVGSGNYVVAFNTGKGPGGQGDWKWCNKCQGLTFAGNPSPGPCPAGGNHTHVGSGNYVVVQNVATGDTQPDWRWCHKCQGLTFAGNPTPGKCPAGGNHDHTGSGAYELNQV